MTHSAKRPNCFNPRATFFIFVLLVLQSVGCKNSANPPQAATQRVSPWPEIARLLSGVPSTRFAGVQQSAPYQKYVKKADQLWTQIQSQNIQPIQSWRRSLSLLEQNAHILYPLSGADFINMALMYPEAATYTMIALEDPGHLDEIAQLSATVLGSELNALHASLYSYGARNYFQSKNMRLYFSHKHFSGILPRLIFFITRMGIVIEDIREITLEPDGTISSKPDKRGGFARGSRDGYEFSLVRPDTGKRQRLLYLKQRLGNQIATADNALGHFFSKKSFSHLILKSAVYLFHMKNFEQAGRFLLARAETVVQDDSGFPYHFFDPKIWDIAFYGIYIRFPIEGTIFHVQQDLQAAYRHKGAEPLPFSFGYGIIKGKNRSNLLLARKRQDAPRRLP